MKRISIRLSEKADKELTELEARTGYSRTAIVQMGVPLAAIALKAKRRGHMLMVADSDGVPTHRVYFENEENA